MPGDFYEGVENTRGLFSSLVGATADHIALQVRNCALEKASGATRRADCHAVHYAASALR